MALIVQNDLGTVSDAVAYDTVANFKIYHALRGNSYSTYTDSLIEQALVKATDYMDNRFAFKGTKYQDTQTTAWPRLDVLDNEDRLVTGIPVAVKKASFEYAYRALTTVLSPDPVASDESGKNVKRVKQSAGPVSQDIEYESSLSLALPRYPAADRLLFAAGLVLSQSTSLARG